MRMTIKKIVILSDLQVPFEDVHVTRNIAKFLQTFKPDQTVTIGDEIDFQTISKWSDGTPLAYEQTLGDDRDRCELAPLQPPVLQHQPPFHSE